MDSGTGIETDTGTGNGTGTGTGVESDRVNSVDGHHMAFGRLGDWETGSDLTGGSDDVVGMSSRVVEGGGDGGGGEDGENVDEANEAETRQNMAEPGI